MGTATSPLVNAVSQFPSKYTTPLRVSVTGELLSPRKIDSAHAVVSFYKASFFMFVWF